MSDDLDEIEDLESEAVEPDDIPSEEDQEEQPEEKHDDEKEEFSRRVNKRIDKLVYERNVAREQNAALLKRLEALEQARQQEISERSTQTLEHKKRDLLQRKREALDVGDYDEVIKIDEELFDVVAEEKQRPKQQQQQPQPQPANTEQSVNPAYDAWHKANSWVYDPNHKSRYEKANKFFHELIQEGYDASDPDLYAELDTRLARVDKPRQAPPPSGVPDRGQSVGNSSKAFTASDKQLMRDFGLDPDNEAHRKEWIRNKR